MRALFCQHLFAKFSKVFLVLIIEHAVTVAFVIRICDLFTKFLADTLIFLTAFQSARTVTAGTLQAIFDHLYNFFVFIESDCHGFYSFFFLLYYTRSVKRKQIKTPIDSANDIL
jgi:hypothetical protein